MYDSFVLFLRYVFFFCKQKTAYEMRISDWSSDGALPISATYWVAVVPNVPGTRLRIDGQYPDARYFSFNAYDPALRPIDGIADARIAPDAGSEIGRASCRERVCQYV